MKAHERDVTRMLAQLRVASYTFNVQVSIKVVNIPLTFLHITSAGSSGKDVYCMPLYLNDTPTMK